MVKREALIEFHRGVIQEAAERLFLEKGVEATSIDEVAKAAGYSKATLYVYFKGKADIWDNIFLAALVRLKDAMAEVVGLQCAAVPKYFALCDAILEFASENPLHFESLLSTISIQDEATARRVRETDKEITEAVCLMLQQGVDEGAFRADADIASIVFFLWSSISGMIRMSGNKEQYYKEELGREKRDMLDFGFKALLKGIQKEG